MKNRRIAALALVFLLGITLRLIAVQSREIFYDDAFSLFLAEKSFSQIIHGTAADTMPPLYYFLLHIWQLGGQGLVYLRLLSVLLSLAILGLSIDLFRRAWGEAAALAGGLILAVSPLQIYHAQELRMYTCLVLGQVLYYWSFFRLFIAEQDKRPRLLWGTLIIGGAMAMYSHNLAIFGLAAANLYLLVRKEWKPFLRLCLSQAVIGALALPWVWMIPGQIQKIQTAFWTPRPGLVEVLQALIQMTAFMPLNGIWLYAAAIITLQIMVLTILETIRLAKKDRIMVFFIFMTVISPLLLFIVSYLMRPVFVPRAFLLSTVGLAGLSARIISKRWKQGIGPLLLGLWLAAAAISLPSFYTFNQFPRSPYRQAVSWLETQVHSGDAVVHENKLSYFPSYFFDRTLPQRFIADEPGSHNDTYAPASQAAIGLIPAENISSAIGSAEKVYFVVFSQAIAEYQTLDSAGEPNLQWLDTHMQLAGHQQFNDLEIFIYQK